MVYEERVEYRVLNCRQATTAISFLMLLLAFCSVLLMGCAGASSVGANSANQTQQVAAAGQEANSGGFVVEDTATVSVDISSNEGGN